MKDFKYQFLLFFGILFLAQVAYANAAIFTDQPLLENPDTTTSNHQFDLLGHSWSGTLTSISYYVSSSATSSGGNQLYMAYTLCRSSSTAPTAGTQYCALDTQVAVGTSSITNVGLQNHSFSVPNVLIEPQYFYEIAFCMVVSSTMNNADRCLSLNGATNLDATWYFSTAIPSGWATSSPTWNVIFNGTSTATIDLAYPNTTGTPEFTNWVVYLPDPVTNATRLGVRFGTNSSSLNLDNSIGYNYLFEGRDYIPIPTNMSFGSSTWYAQAYIRNASGNIAVDDIFQFNVSRSFTVSTTPEISELAGPFGPLQQTYIPTAQIVCQQPSSTGIFSNPIDNLAYQLCVWTQFMFSPDSGQQFFNNSYQDFQNSFPFSIFYSLKTAIDTSASTTMSSSSADLVIPFDFGSSTINVPLLTSTTVSSTLGSAVASYWFSLMTFIIYATLGVVIYHTVI